ncbi:MAG: capsular biosynthesis protein [Pseudomonadota bacterium]
MIASEKVLVVDIDGTLCDIKPAGGSYADVAPEPRMMAKLRALRAEGWRIVLSSARGMRSNDGNLGQIMVTVAPTLIDWLARHEVPYDELHLGKPWPGRDGFYVDDRAVRPREFLEHDLEGLAALVARDRVAGDGGDGTA